MQKLQRLINSLSSDELLAIREIEAVGKQRQVLSYCISQYQVMPLGPGHPLALKKITIGHLHQICSVMLRRCYDALIPDGGFPLLEFLCQRNLLVLFREVLRRFERDVIEVASLKEQQEMYRRVMTLLYRFDFTLVDPELLAEIRETYMRLSVGDAKSILLYDGIELLEGLRYQLFAADDIFVVVPKLDEAISAYEKRSTKSGNANTQYLACCARAHYWFFTKYDADKTEESYRQAEQYIAQVDIPLYQNEARMFPLRYADIEYARGNHSKAYKLFSSYLSSKEYYPVFEFNQYYLIRYVELAICNSDYATARKVLEKELAFAYFMVPSYVAVQVSIMHALVELFTGGADAIRYIEMAFDYNSKKNYQLFSDIRCRLVECACYMIVHDFKHARVLINRCKQILRSRRLGVNVYSAGNLFTVLSTLMDCADAGKDLAGEALERYDKYSTNTYGPYGLMLTFVKNKLKVGSSESVVSV